MELRNILLAACLIVCGLAVQSHARVLLQDSAGVDTTQATVVPVTPADTIVTQATDVAEIDAEVVQDVATSGPISRARARRAAAEYAAVLAAGQISTAAAANSVPAQYQYIHSQHNVYRATHRAPALTWDATLAANASAWVSQCRFGIDKNAKAGENVYATTKSNTTQALRDAIKSWYDQNVYYNYNKPGYTSSAGCFTQVVWKNSTLLGCAVQYCSSLSGSSSVTKGSFVSCRYTRPPGNIQGQFAQNVLKPNTTSG